VGSHHGIVLEDALQFLGIVYAAGNDGIWINRSSFLGRKSGISGGRGRKRQIAAYVAFGPLRRWMRLERGSQERPEIKGQQGGTGQSPQHEDRCQKTPPDKTIVAMAAGAAAHPDSRSFRVGHNCSYTQSTGRAGGAPIR